MANINDFLQNKKNYLVVNKFDEEIQKVTDKEDQRKLEIKYLKPDKLPEFIQDSNQKGYSKLKDVTIKLVFGNDYYFELFQKYFHINTYVENNVSDLKLLYRLLDLLESGVIGLEAKD